MALEAELVLALAQVAAKGPHRFAKTDDVRALSVAMQRPPRLARELARHITRDTYRFEPLRKAMVPAQGKTREIYQATFTDAVIYRWLANRLNAALAPTLPPYVYGFRKGVSSLTAARALAVALRAADVGPPPRRPGVFVLRRDISKYTDHIRTADGAPLWRALERAGLWREEVAPRGLLRRALQASCVDATTAGAGPAVVGFVAAGTAIANIMANVYLLEMDEAIAKRARFYGRFGDDIIAVFDEARVAGEAAQALDRRATALELRFGAEKRLDLYLSRSGFLPPAHRGYVGRAAVDWLGVRITAAGQLALPPNKARALVNDLVRRAALAVNVAGGATQLGPGAAIKVAAALRAALDPASPLVLPRLLDYLLRVDSRAQLAELDYRWLLRASEIVARRRGPRAWRVVSMRAWRDTYGVPTLTLLRNRGYRAPLAREAQGPAKEPTP